MRIQIVTDAWLPQVNGVVTTLRNTVAELERVGHDVGLVTPAGFRSIPCPTYPEIRLAIAPGRGVAKLMEDFDPDAVHIATEGPLGLAARRHCVASGREFTTSYHTQFPEYVRARCGMPLTLGYAVLRKFHRRSSTVMVATDEMQMRLRDRGFERIARWTRGVDTQLFTPAPRDGSLGGRPIFLYAGRVAVEKSIDKFLELDLPGTKWVVGDGPARARLQARFPAARFHGMQHGRDLAWFYQQADVFVFPSRTDTFGLVLVEAMACGTPVAAYPVSGPIDVVRGRSAGVLSEDLGVAALTALTLDRKAVRDYAETFSWTTATRQFIANLRPRSDGREPVCHGPVIVAPDNSCLCP